MASYPCPNDCWESSKEGILLDLSRGNVANLSQSGKEGGDDAAGEPQTRKSVALQAQVLVSAATLRWIAADIVLARRNVRLAAGLRDGWTGTPPARAMGPPELPRASHWYRLPGWGYKES